MTNQLSYQERVKGMLLGLHAGDVLGATLEFKAPQPDLSHRDIIGGGDFNWRPGQATDDTDLMVFVLQSMTDRKTLDLSALRTWLIKWHDQNPPDIGNTTRRGIVRLKEGHAFGGTTDDPSESNGSLMRVAPLAILEQPQTRLDEILTQQAALTHGNRVCAIGDRIFVGALRKALQGENRIQIAQFIMEEARRLDWFPNEIERSATCSWDELQTSGWAVHTLGSVVWALNHAVNLEDALVKIANRGDDSDTTGAVVGAMFGALEGTRGIPKRWLDKLERAPEINSEIHRLLAK